MLTNWQVFTIQDPIHVRMHSNERHPNLPKRPPFDPDTYIKNKLASAKTPYDPDDYAW